MGAFALAAVVGTVAIGTRWRAPTRAHAITAGVRAYIDPNTGEPGLPPSASAAPSIGAARQEARLVEVPSTGPAGGVMINAKGRMADVLATTEGGGATTMHCAPHANGSDSPE